MTTEFEIGKTVVESEDGGPVVSHVHDIDLTGAYALHVPRRDFLTAAAERLPDDYPTVWVYCNGKTLAICDHETPIPGAGERHINDVEETVHRTDVLETGDDTVKTLFTREHLVGALNSLDDERVLVHPSDEFPLIIEGTDEAVAVAPQVKA